MRKSKTLPDFDSFLPTIDAEIAKRRHKWNLTSLSYMDFDDVSQIIRIHIFKKWDQYNPVKPIQPWLNSIITNQIRNLIRNHYTNFARPCLRCSAALENKCRIYGEQCADCPLYAKWMKRKQPAQNVRIPVSIENHQHEVRQLVGSGEDVFRNIQALHDKMKEVLKPIELQVYEGLFVHHQEEHQVAKTLGYISNEKGRRPGYKQIKNIRKSIISKVKKCLSSGEVDII